MHEHFHRGRFRNPLVTADRRFWQFLRWMATRRKERWPRWVEEVPPGPVPPADARHVAATFVNHSTFLLQVGGRYVLTDPVWSERASPLSWAGPRRVRRPGVALEDLPPVSLVLVSHNHYDHMDLATLRHLRDRFDPLFVTSLGNRRYLRRRGLRRVEELDWWQSLRGGPDLEVTLTPAQHFSARGLFDRNRTLWGGFLLAWGPSPPTPLPHRGRGESSVRVYFAGDSGYGEHFRTIGERAGSIDLALLPIGAYEPRWFMRPAHVNPAEAVQVHLDLRPRLSIAMHFGTFQLTDEAIDEPIRALREALARRGVDENAFRVPAFGETIFLPVA
jgi:L-ascorbate metabolism protein UlaG (beta-lactamase superfamily)